MKPRQPLQAQTRRDRATIVLTGRLGGFSLSHMDRNADYCDGNSEEPESEDHSCKVGHCTLLLLITQIIRDTVYSYHKLTIPQPTILDKIIASAVAVPDHGA